MSEIAILWLTFPPSANRLWRYVGGKPLKSEEYRKWMRSNALAAEADGVGTITGPYALHLRVCRPDKRRRDLDNLIKPVNDFLVQALIVQDDSMCQSITAEWATLSHPGVRVAVVATSEAA